MYIRIFIHLATAQCLKTITELVIALLSVYTLAGSYRHKSISPLTTHHILDTKALIPHAIMALKKS